MDQRLLEPDVEAGTDNLRPRRRYGVLTKALLLLGLAAAFFCAGWFATTILRMLPAGVVVRWAVVLLVAAVAVLAIVGATVHELSYWLQPLRRMQRTLNEVHSGRAPISELQQIRGGVQVLVPPLMQILRDLRKQKRELSAIQDEMKQRIANRTDALQRTIGSLRHQANADELTGLHNRRAMEQVLPAALDDAVAHRTPLCAVMMDIDDFKLLNDRLGHAAGDSLLRSLGQLIRSSIREQDAAFRLGGDEFLVLLPGTNRKGAEIFVQRLTSLVDGLARTFHLPRQPRVSAGIGALDELQAPSAQVLLESADKDLYRVKQARKSQLAPLAGDGPAATIPRSN